MDKILVSKYLKGNNTLPIPPPVHPMKISEATYHWLIDEQARLKKAGNPSVSFGDIVADLIVAELDRREARAVAQAFEERTK